MPSRQDRGYAGANRAFANFKFTVSADQGRIADFNARDIRDRVKPYWCAFKRNPEIARANNLAYDYWLRRRRFLRLARGRIERDYEHEQEHETREAFRFHFRSINYQLPTINSEGFRESTFPFRLIACATKFLRENIGPRLSTIS